MTGTSLWPNPNPLGVLDRTRTDRRPPSRLPSRPANRGPRPVLDKTVEGAEGEEEASSSRCSVVQGVAPAGGMAIHPVGLWTIHAIRHIFQDTGRMA